MPYKIRAQKKKEVSLLQIQSRTEEFIDEALAHPQRIWGSIAVLVLLGIGFFTMQFFDKQAEETAWGIEAEASKLFHEPAPLPQPIEEGDEEEPTELLDEQDRLKRSSELYNEILEKHSGTNAATIALFESGNVYFKMASYEEAEARYMTFLKKYPERKSLVVLVHLRLAYLYQQKGDQSAAREHFQRIYEMTDATTRDQAGFELARSLESDEKLDAAKSLYEKISEEYSESPWGVEAKARLILLSPSEEDNTPKADETSQTLEDKVLDPTKGDVSPAEDEKAKGGNDVKSDE